MEEESVSNDRGCQKRVCVKKRRVVKQQVGAISKAQK